MSGFSNSRPVHLSRGERSRRPRFSSRELYDVCLALSANKRPVGNDIAADGKSLIIVTGANQGGKTTFLRSLGLAQLMTQMRHVRACREPSSSTSSNGLFTHFKREEDATMKSGKFDEELSRMNEIVDVLTPTSLILFNESFAATNEREGSEIARQIVSALLERVAQGRVRQPSVRLHPRLLREAARRSAVPARRQAGRRTADVQTDRKRTTRHKFRRGRVPRDIFERKGACR